MGRPLKLWAKLKKSSRRSRACRARLAEQHVPQLLLPLLTAAATIDEEAARQQEAEDEARADAERRQTALDKLERQLGERNPAANGPAVLILRAAARVEGDEDCGICCSSDVLVQSMRCCGNACCAPCLGQWLRRHGKMEPVGYGENDRSLGVDEACEMRASATYSEACRRARGRVIKVRMNTHRCPWCAQPIQSVRRGLV